MGWGHPALAFEDLMKLIKGFVDILILTSGFQSSGRDVHWDPPNITRAFQWALFFENVLMNLSHLDDVYGESMKQLDAALLEITSSDSFPQGLKRLSAATLAKARRFLVGHFVDTLPLKGPHLRAFMTAVIEMDLEEFSGDERDRLSAYLENLKLRDTGGGFSECGSGLSPEVSLMTEAREFRGGSLTDCAVEKLVRRWYAVSDKFKIDKILKAVAEKIEFDDDLIKEQVKQTDAPEVVEQCVGFVAWNRWRSKSLCYFLHKRTIRIVSGANLIFSAPTIQWAQVLKRLNNPLERSCDDLRDTVELLLLGCITNRLTNIIEFLMAVSFNSITTSEQYSELCKLLRGKSQAIQCNKETMISKGNDILEYLTGLLGGQLLPLWNVPSALAAFAIPFWSPLFRLYMSELEIQIRGGSSKMRCCNCNQEGNAHSECELAERIWCLYIFHVYVASQTDADTSYQSK